MSRTAKQVRVIAGFLFFAGVVLGSFWLVLRTPPTCTDGKQNQKERGVDCGGPCTATCVSDLSVLKTQGDILRFEAGGKTIFLATVANPNEKFAARRFPYVINYTDSAGSPAEVSGESWLYGGQERYIAAFVEGPASLPSFKFLGPIDWQTAADYPRAEVEVLNFQSESTTSSIKISGSLINRGAAPIKRAQVVVILKNSYGLPAGVSITETGYMSSGQQEIFSLIHPTSSAIDVSRSSVFVYGQR